MATLNTALSSWHVHFLQLARYNRWATGRLFDAMAVLPDADYRRDVGLFFKSIHGTLNHFLWVSTCCGIRDFPKAHHRCCSWMPKSKQTANAWRRRSRAARTTGRT